MAEDFIMNKIQIISAIEHAWQSLRGMNLESNNHRREFAEKVADLLMKSEVDPITVNIVQGASGSKDENVEEKDD